MAKPATFTNIFGALGNTDSVAVIDSNNTSIAGVINDGAVGWVNYALDTGTANNYVVTLPTGQIPTAYLGGFRLTMKPLNTNTGSSVINVNGLGSQPIVDPAGNALVGSEILAGVMTSLIYTTLTFQLVAVPLAPGTVHLFGGTITQAGWLLCNGQAVSRTTFNNLFLVIGTNYGAGDGSTTFNVPNFNNVFPYSTTGTPGTSGGSSTISVANLPPHNHPVNDPQHSHAITDPTHTHTYIFPNTIAASGVGVGGGAQAGGTTGASATGITVNSAATNISTANTGSGAAYLPPYLTVRYIIKT